MLTTKRLRDRRTQRNRNRLRKLGRLRPRLTVFRSSKQIYVQLIDDTAGRTLASASSVEKDLRVFDRGGYLYHGRVKALADAAREGGLDF